MKAPLPANKAPPPMCPYMKAPPKMQTPASNREAGAGQSPQCMTVASVLSAGRGISWPTFRSGAQYPQARIEHDHANDEMLWQYYSDHETFAGAEVYIEANVCDDPAAAARDDYFKADTRWPTFMSAAQHPWARIEHDRDGDDRLRIYFIEHQTFNGAMVYIKPDKDNEPVDVIWNRHGYLVMMQSQPVPAVATRCI